MTVTVINKFAVPPEARQAFLEEFGAHRAFLAGRPGFEKGALHEQTAGPGRFNFVNIAVWRDQVALDAARAAMGAEWQRRGSDPRAVYRSLGVESDIASYAVLEDY